MIPWPTRPKSCCATGSRRASGPKEVHRRGSDQIEATAWERTLRSKWRSPSTVTLLLRYAHETTLRLDLMSYLGNGWPVISAIAFNMPIPGLSSSPVLAKETQPERIILATTEQGQATRTDAAQGNRVPIVWYGKIYWSVHAWNNDRAIASFL